MRTIEITDEAADCLAFFMGHWAYGDTFSEVIVNHTLEWGCREFHKLTSLEQMGVTGSYEEKKQ